MPNWWKCAQVFSKLRSKILKCECLSWTISKYHLSIIGTDKLDWANGTWRHFDRLNRAKHANCEDKYCPYLRLLYWYQEKFYLVEFRPSATSGPLHVFRLSRQARQPFLRMKGSDRMRRRSSHFDRRGYLWAHGWSRCGVSCRPHRTSDCTTVDRGAVGAVLERLCVPWCGLRPLKCGPDFRVCGAVQWWTSQKYFQVLGLASAASDGLLVDERSTSATLVAPWLEIIKTKPNHLNHG